MSARRRRVGHAFARGVLAFVVVVFALATRPAFGHADGLSLSVDAPANVTMPTVRCCT